MTPSAPDLLVFGGTGLLGRRLVATATGRTVATRCSSPPIGTRVGWQSCDLADGGTTAALLIDRLRPTAVINAAYVQGGDHLRAVTALAPGEMAAACARVGARFIHLSTDVVFDGTTDRPYREDDPVSPVHDYGRAKAEAETRVAAAHRDALIVRTSLLWGDRDDPGPQVEMTADPGVTFFTDEYRSPLEASVLAAACLELTARSGISGILHVAGADTVDRLDFARRVSRLVDVDPSTLRGGPGSVARERPSNCALDSSRARMLLSTPLRGVKEATA